MKRAMLIGVLAVGLLGCGPNEQAVVGEWKGDVRLTAEEQKQPFSNLASGFAGAIQLECKPDRTFRLLLAVLPVEGTWKLEGRTLRLTPREVLGMKEPFEAKTKEGATVTARWSQQETVLELSPDGQTLTVQTTGDQDPAGDFFFRRVEPVR